MKLCFFTIWREDSETIGINQKIRNQVKAFSNLGLDSFLCISSSSFVTLYHYDINKKQLVEAEKREFSRKSDHSAFHNKVLKKLSSISRLNECLDFMDSMNKKNNFDVIYIRRIIPLTLNLIKKIKEWHSGGAKVYWEIPTFGEVPKSLANWITYKTEEYGYRLLQNSMSIVAISSKKDTSSNYIFINNGVDNDSIKVRNYKKHNGINIICLATFLYWQGYDRLLNGLKEYYDNYDPQKDIEVHVYMVGNGSYVKDLIQITHDNKIEEYVHFMGALTGDDLNNIFDNMDLAFGNIGFFRKGVVSDTSLKIREYCSRGIPFVTALKINDFPNDFPYILHVPMDESYINIKTICIFVQNLDQEKATSEMRLFAENNLSWEKQLVKIIQ